MMKSHAVVENLTRDLEDNLAQMWLVRGEQNVAVIRTDNLVPVSVPARNVEMILAKEILTMTQGLPSPGDER